MNIRDFVRPEVLNLPTINAPDISDGMIRLNANEAPQYPSIDDSIDLNRYPPIRPTTLNQKMAEFYSVNKNEILISRGSTEAIDTIIRTFCRPNTDTILISPPTFDMYKFFANLNSISVCEVPLLLKNNFELNIEDIIDSIKTETKLIFLSSPNNPCGSSVSNDNVVKILKAADDSAIVVLDEAYIEFSPLKTMIDMINDYPNLIILRTLSKAHALAGARCGAMISNNESIGMLKKILPPFSFSIPNINRIESALSSKYKDNAQLQIKTIIQERNRITKELIHFKCIDKIWNSDGNFIMIKFNNLELVVENLNKRNILVGLLKNNTALEQCSRITIGTEIENNLLLEALSDMD